MIAYLGSDQLKRDFLDQITQHEQQDALIKGTYGKTNGMFRGCAIGCSLHSLNILQGKADLEAGTDVHSRYEEELGIPTWLAYLEDNIFENLPDDLSQTWPRRFAAAIPVGAVVTDRVLARILWWTLASDDFGVRHTTDDAEVRGWIDTIAACLDAEATGEASADQREAAARAAWAAWAAWAARAVRAAWAAWAARAARAVRAVRAVRAAWAAWDAWDARDAAQPSAAAKKAPAFYPALSEYVLEQLRALATVAAA